MWFKEQWSKGREEHVVFYFLHDKVSSTHWKITDFIFQMFGFGIFDIEFCNIGILLKCGLTDIIVIGIFYSTCQILNLSLTKRIEEPKQYMNDVGWIILLL